MTLIAPKVTLWILANDPKNPYSRGILFPHMPKKEELYRGKTRWPEEKMRHSKDVKAHDSKHN